MTIRIQRILIPVDFSENSIAALNYACALAEKYAAELHLLHALEIHPITTPDFGMGLDLPRYAEEPRASAAKKLGQLLDPTWSQKHAVVQAIVEGSPVKEIIGYARMQTIDLIVVSTHGRTGLAHVLMGGVTENIVRMAPCPVLTVRPHGHQFVMP